MESDGVRTVIAVSPVDAESFELRLVIDGFSENDLVFVRVDRDSTVVKSVIDGVCSYFKLDSHLFGLCMEGRWLNVTNTLGAHGCDPSHVVQLRYRFWDPHARVDSRLLGWHYSRVRESILSGRFPCETAVSVSLHSHMLCVDFGPYECDTHTMHWIRGHICCALENHPWKSLALLDPAFSITSSCFAAILSLQKCGIPKPIARSIGRLVWIDGAATLVCRAISREWKALEEDRHDLSQAGFIERCKTMKTYGMTTWNVREREDGKKKLKDMLLGINMQGVFRIDPHTRLVMSVWPLTSARRWASGINSWTLDMGSY